MKLLPQRLRLASAALLAGMACPGSLLALQDLDGDGKPDTVAVDAGFSSRGITSYALRISLSSLPAATTIEFELPAAGLRVQMRDVDGDRDEDLVVSDQYNRAVAVFLNGGDGSFSLSSDPGLYGLNAPVRGPCVCTPPGDVPGLAWAGTAASDLIPDAARAGFTIQEAIAPMYMQFTHNGRAGMPASRAPPSTLS